MIVRRVHERRGWGWQVAVPIVRPMLIATTKPEWIDGEKIPAEGGCVLVFNHLSHVDPLTVAHLLWNHGRVPRYLAKSSLFKTRGLGSVMRGLGAIPVERASRNAAGAFEAAVAAVRRGECVVVYPEGTITRDPEQWPMVGKTGAARIALETDCPVIPVGQWGAQEILPAYSHRPDLFPRKQITMKVGDPVDLTDLRARDRTAAVISEATDRIMNALTALVGEIRGEQPPAVRYDPRKDRAS